MSIIRNRFSGDNNRSNHRLFNQALVFDGINDHLMMEGTTGIAKDIYDNFNFTNKWAVSFWINPLTNTGGNYLMLNWMRTPRLFAQGQWNISTSGGFDLMYGGQSSTGGTWGFQRFVSGLSQNNFKTYTFNKRNTLTHCLWVYDNTAALADRITVYLNGNKSFTTNALNTNLTLNATAANYIFTIGVWSYNNTAFVYVPHRLTEFVMINNYIPTASEAQSIYNYGPNGYSATVLSNRFLHLPLGRNGAADFDVNAGQLRALDISGNNRHINLFGQGTTPTLVNVY